NWSLKESLSWDSEKYHSHLLDKAPLTSTPASAPAATQAPAPAVPQPAQSATPVAASTSIVNAPSENMYNQATSNLVAGSNLEGTVQQLLDMGGGIWDRYTVCSCSSCCIQQSRKSYRVSLFCKPLCSAPTSCTTSGPNVNPLDLFPQVCKPKKKFGGLGLKNLKDWNEALLAKHIWNIASKKDTLWVKWVHMMRLKDASIWNVEYNANNSWNWQCLLEVKDKIANRLKYEIGDGNSIHTWQDNWHSSGLLINQISNRDLYDARVPEKYSLADMIDNGN
nr:RNA-directed DNA polymerase, eukaryota, reverse transcriptase zinc-binding domain protein [Tanacetum cinerariifolium]